MGVFNDNIKPILKRKDILVRLIVINVAVFLLLVAINITKLFEINITEDVMSFLIVPSNLGELASRFWTPLTYMFVHVDFFHILFNMLVLYGFGRIFLSHFNAKNLGSLYVLGGLAGAIIFILAYNTIPLFARSNNAVMWGASASVMAIVFAAAFYRPNTEVFLFFLLRIKIIYIALIIFVLDFIGIAGDSNPGGHMAHIGGALVGYIYAKQYLKGKDITKWISKVIDSIANLSKPSKKMKVKHSKRDADYQHNERKKDQAEEIDRILDKIKAAGYSSLSADEKKRLFDASKK